jgi:hypothetical protein
MSEKRGDAGSNKAPASGRRLNHIIHVLSMFLLMITWSKQALSRSVEG